MTHHMPATVRRRGPDEGGRAGLGLGLLQFHFVLRRKRKPGERLVCGSRGDGVWVKEGDGEGGEGWLLIL